jgi:MoaD family protein
MTTQVRVLLHAMFKEAAGKGEMTHELGSDSTLGKLLSDLAREYGKDFNQILNPKTGLVEVDALVMLNGQSVRKPDVPLKDGDVVMITVPIGGG